MDGAADFCWICCDTAAAKVGIYEDVLVSRVHRDYRRYCHSGKTPFPVGRVVVLTVLCYQVYLYLKFDRAIGRDDQNSTLIQNKKRFPVYLALFGVAQ